MHRRFVSSLIQLSSKLISGVKKWETVIDTRKDTLKDQKKVNWEH